MVSCLLLLLMLLLSWKTLKIHQFQPIVMKSLKHFIFAKVSGWSFLSAYFLVTLCDPKLVVGFKPCCCTSLYSGAMKAVTNCYLQKGYKMHVCLNDAFDMWTIAFHNIILVHFPSHLYWWSACAVRHGCHWEDHIYGAVQTTLNTPSHRVNWKHHEQLLSHS